jgi:hypothetical protein
MWRWIGLLRLLWLVVVAVLALAPRTAGQPGPFAVPTNPIIEENKQPGSPDWRLNLGEYQVSDDRGRQIKGYASATSVNKGEPIRFYISTNPPQTYSIDVYRLGYYGGAGGRLMQHLTGVGATQPACPEQPGTGLIECDWSPSLSLDVPDTWTSGIYVGLLTNADNYQDYITFVVRDDERASDILYQEGVLTYEAYNDYPNDGPDGDRPETGKSLYRFDSSRVPTVSIDGERATKVSLDRPMAEPRQGTFLDWDVYTVEWLEQAGYDVSYQTDIDTHLHPENLLKHKAFISAGHDEYWTRQMYDGVEAARDSGVNLAFLGADAVHSQVRLEPSTTHDIPDRVIVCYRDPNLDPMSDPRLKTVEWRDPLLNRPQQTLIGVQYSGGLAANAPFVVQSSADTWAFLDTGFQDGDQTPNIVGYETDGFDPAYPPPENITRSLLSSSPYVDNFGNTTVSNASVYEAERSGAWVFASGTMSWSWALARPDYIDPRVQRLTRNVFDRFVAGGVTTTGTLPAGNVAPGSSVTINASAENTHSTEAKLLIDVAVVADDGSTQFQEVFNDQTLEPGELRTFSVPWSVPANARAGSDKLVVAAFAPDWSPLREWQAWMNEAATFTVT